MKSEKNTVTVFWKNLIACLLLSAFLVMPAEAEEERYVFERMWPTLQQPWYFNNPSDVAVDKDGNVYVADTDNHRIQKFGSDGTFITKWGSQSLRPGLFIPTGIAVDSAGFVYVAEGPGIHKFGSDGTFISGELASSHRIGVDSAGFVYVADTYNDRIQKFGSDGTFISKWGSSGSADGQFDSPYGIAVDSAGFVYVTDIWNDRIQKFASDGTFIGKWGSEGSGDGQFDNPKGIGVDSDGFVYVVDSYNDRIQKFSSDGTFISKWGSRGSEGGQFMAADGIAIYGNSFVYVVDNWSNRIQKFRLDGTFISKWESRGSGDGQFFWPLVAIDGTNFIYVADSADNRIQKFDSDGRFISKWGSDGAGDGQFDGPGGIAVDGVGFVYVADSYNARIQKFSSDGTFISKWGEFGSGDGQFNYRHEGIAVDGAGFVYVADTRNERIQKFDSGGKFISKWGEFGSGDGQFSYPNGIAVDGAGFVYVVDETKNCIQKFDSGGKFISKWGDYGSGEGQFSDPQGIAVDGAGFVYVADSGNNRIQKFTSDGIFIMKFSRFGSDLGLLNYPTSVCVSPDGRVYVAEYGNNRIQIFRKTEVTEGKNKAVILAGGGPGDWNNLWDATQMAANFAYRALTYQGFTKETIYYLTSDTDLDLDDNGEADDVDGDATNANLQYALTQWAKDADRLVIYLVDHGGNGTFRMSGTQTLSAADLDSWTDTAQQNISEQVIVIYDACESGSFLSALTPPPDKKRIVITGTSPGESAYFITQGSISFSNYFWTHIFNGYSLKDAFELARKAMSEPRVYQHPLLDADGNGKGNESADYTLTGNICIGNGTRIQGESPVIASISPNQTISGKNSATLYAESVTDKDGIARGWAVIRPPDFRQASPDNPVHRLPYIDFLPAENNRWEAAYSKFDIEGTYQIAVYARDRIGNVGVPLLTTVSVNNPMRRRAVIVLGGSPSGELMPALENMGKTAYNALRFQGYSDDDIYFMSPVTFSAGVDGLPTLSNLNHALTTWAGDNTQDMVLYFAGKGDDGTFTVNETERLSAEVLNGLLDMLQEKITGKVVFIYDAARSGSFFKSLIPPAGKERILMSGSGENQQAYFLSQGDISFSGYFWRRASNGETVRDAFVYAKKAMSLQCEYQQTPYMDDNGNGVGNEDNYEGQLARGYTIGVGIMLAGDDPLIGSVSSEQTLNGQRSATIRAENVTGTGKIERVWAVITPPDTQNLPENPVIMLPAADLSETAPGMYEGAYHRFLKKGTYSVSVYARDISGNVSLPSSTRIIQSADVHIEEIKGDVNGDGFVNLRDALLSLRVLAESDTSGLLHPEYAESGVDVNGDNKIGTAEAVYALRAAAESK